MKELWIKARESLIQRCIDEGMSEGDAEDFADDYIDDSTRTTRADAAFADMYGDMVDAARQRYKDSLI